MKPSAFRIERLLANVEAEVERRGLRARRYVFHPDEVAEAEAQGLPYVLLPRVLSGREWIERYGGQPPPIQGDQMTDYPGRVVCWPTSRPKSSAEGCGRAGTSFILTRSLRQKRKACPTCSYPGF